MLGDGRTLGSGPRTASHRATACSHRHHGATAPSCSCRTPHERRSTLECSPGGPRSSGSLPSGRQRGTAADIQASSRQRSQWHSRRRPQQAPSPTALSEHNDFIHGNADPKSEWVPAQRQCPPVAAPETQQAARGCAPSARTPSGPSQSTACSTRDTAGMRSKQHRRQSMSRGLASADGVARALDDGCGAGQCRRRFS